MVKIRLSRLGTKQKPFYRIIVADSRTKRDGNFVEILGTYNPQKNPTEFKIDLERANHWLSKGAQPTVIVKKLIKKAGQAAA